LILTTSVCAAAFLLVLVSNFCWEEKAAERWMDGVDRQMAINCTLKTFGSD